MDFTQMPVSQGYRYLIVMIDTFTGWVEGFPTQTEKAEEVVKKLLHEIILRFGLPRSLQSEYGTSFTSKVAQGVSKALGIPYYLHCAWRPQSSGKVETANQFLKSVIKMINRETSLGWKEDLPIALLCTHIAPKEQLVLMRCYMGDLLFMSMTSSWIQRLRPSSFIAWPLGDSNRIYICGVSTRIQKIPKSHLYKLQGLKSYLKSGMVGPQRLNSSPHGRAPNL